MRNPLLRPAQFHTIVVHRILHRLQDVGWDSRDVGIDEDDDPEDVDEWVNILVQPVALSETSK